MLSEEVKEKVLNYNDSKVDLILTDDLFKENPEWWEDKCKDIDTIIHLAWYVEPGKYLKSIKNLDCMIGSLNLVHGAIKSKIKRFVGVGTCFEYDLNHEKLSIDTPLNPITPYAAAKASYLALCPNYYHFNR